MSDDARIVFYFILMGGVGCSVGAATAWAVLAKKFGF